MAEPQGLAYAGVDVGGTFGGAGAVRVVSRAGLTSEESVTGPALLEQPDTTALLACGEVAVVEDAGNLVVHLPCTTVG
ncbi:MAG: hypothetical protein ACRDQU_15750 [Pseudonocardiaceae bacterium]